MSGFTSEQLSRYSRQINLDEFGLDGQSKIRASKVLVVGLGGIGSPAAFYLAAAGVGTLGISDHDRVDLSNLQRQVLHFTADLNRAKVDSAADKIKALNPDVKVRKHKRLVARDNIREIIDDFHFVIDGSDNLESKFLINDACVKAGLPYSHGGILGFNAQTMTIIPGRSACYRCLHNQPPAPETVPDPAAVGVLGSCAGMLGTIQASEALKYIVGAGNLLTDRLLIINAKDMTFQQVKLNRQPDCPLCGKNASPT